MNYTAEQLAINVSIDLANGIIDNQRIIDIQTYGRKCAEKALKDASENAYNIDDGHDIDGNCIHTISKDSILNTIIQTP
ncbi:hypothetical protein [uncultured Clostridium sp.]|uniref:hypothetical protein n=1 Tax=uncultured Clostridium sp. TaxID=59620 RepID=UPI002616E6FF|nr:hypothetical protein [uncultured Clostridium sp.]